MEGMGKPSYGNTSSVERPRRTWFRIAQDSENIYRIAPPIKSLASKGIWKVFYKVHYGYSIVTEEGHRRKAPFQCVERTNRRTKELEQECPECREVNAAIAKANMLRDKLAREPNASPEAREMLKHLDAWVKDHKVSKNWYVNAINPAGEVGILSFRYKMGLALETLIKQLRTKDNIDPIDASQGCWLNFFRTGDGPSAIAQVEAVHEERDFNGKRFKSIKDAPLSEAQCQEILAKGADLDEDLFVDIGVERVQMLVDSGGDPEQVRKIMGYEQRRNKEVVATLTQDEDESPFHDAPVVDVPQPSAMKAASVESLSPTMSNKNYTNEPINLAPAAPVPSAGPITAQEPELLNLQDPRKMTKEQFLALFGGK